MTRESVRFNCLGLCSHVIEYVNQGQQKGHGSAFKSETAHPLPLPIARVVECCGLVYRLGIFERGCQCADDLGLSDGVTCYSSLSCNLRIAVEGLQILTQALGTCCAV